MCKCLLRGLPEMPTCIVLGKSLRTSSLISDKSVTVWTRVNLQSYRPHKHGGRGQPFKQTALDFLGENPKQIREVKTHSNHFMLSTNPQNQRRS